MSRSDLPSADLLNHLPPHNRLWLALSGGLDSVVLLDLAVRHCQRQGKSLQVIHIHHGLSANADRWAEHCATLCRDYQQRFAVGIGYRCSRVQLAEGASVELQARKARYQVFEELLAEGDLLLMAHHGDDQLETLLLRLMRGAGSAGLAGIPQSRALARGALYRPLLALSRDQLEQYARQQALSWLEDESNRSEAFDRNFLRHQVTPLLKQRWSKAVAVAGRSAQALADSDSLNRELAEMDLAQVRLSEQVLSCAELGRLSPVRQANLLRYWLAGFAIAAPEYRQIEQIRQDLLQAAGDGQPCFARPGFELRRYRDQLHLQLSGDGKTPAGPSGDTTPPEPAAHQLSLPLQQRQAQLMLDQVAFSCSGDTTARPGQSEGSALICLPGPGLLSLAHRLGGERLSLAGRGHKSVKKLLQEAGVPAWLRSQVRLFYWQTDTQARCIGLWSPQLDPQGVPLPGGRFWWHHSVVHTACGRCAGPELKITPLLNPDAAVPDAAELAPDS